jgi:hypothetical protein
LIQNASKPNFTTPAAIPKHLNFLVAGVAGAAKTTLLGLTGPASKVMICDTEAGTAAFQSPWFRSHAEAAELDNIHVVTFGDVTSSQELVHRVEGNLDYLIRTGNRDGYALFALDSLTEFQERFLSLHSAPDRRQSYGALREAVYAIVNKARQAPVHCVFTARLKATFDEVLGREVVRPEVSPGVWSVVSGLFDQIGFLDLKTQGVKSSRVLSFQHTLRTQGKDRAGIGELSDPTMTEIFNRIAGTGAPTNTDKQSPRAAAPVRAAVR